MTPRAATLAGRPVLDLRGVQWSHPGPEGPVRVLDGIDLAVAPGEVVAVAGRSGSGKTSLLTVAAGWVAPDAGTVELCGAPVAGGPPWAALALLPQSLGLLDELTLAENVSLPLRLAGEGRWRRGSGAADAAGPADAADRVLDRLGLSHLGARHPAEVSLGEQQRAALARAAVLRPSLLVADEPLSHQNREWAVAMMDLIGTLAADGTACLLATHDELAITAADRALELRRGRLEPRET